jgi:hypothetical protein
MERRSGDGEYMVSFSGPRRAYWRARRPMGTAAAGRAAWGAATASRGMGGAARRRQTAACRCGVSPQRARGGLGETIWVVGRRGERVWRLSDGGAPSSSSARPGRAAAMVVSQASIPVAAVRRRRKRWRGRSPVERRGLGWR